MDLSVLSDDERAALKEALMSGDDIAECKEAIGSIAAVLQEVVSKVDALEKLVQDEIIGGITKLYDENMRFENIEGLKKKHGAAFEGMDEPFHDLYDSDLWEKLQDLIDETKGEAGDGYTDEMGDGKIAGIAEALKGKLAKLKGGNGQAPAAIEVEVTKAAPAPELSMEDRIKRMKGKGGRVPGMIGDTRD